MQNFWHFPIKSRCFTKLNGQILGITGLILEHSWSISRNAYGCNTGLLLPFPVFAVCLPAIASTRHISGWTAVRIQARAFGDASCNEDVVVCCQVVRLWRLSVNWFGHHPKNTKHFCKVTCVKHVYFNVNVRAYLIIAIAWSVPYILPNSIYATYYANANCFKVKLYWNLVEGYFNHIEFKIQVIFGWACLTTVTP